MDLTKGFCLSLKNPKIREKHGSGWVREAPTRIFFWGGRVVSFFVHVSKKVAKNRFGGGWVSGVWSILVF